MTCKFIAFHTMIRGSGKPQYMAGITKGLAERGARVLVIDGLMYEQSALAHQFYKLLGTSLSIPRDGRNLYDLIGDYATLCAGNKTPPRKASPQIQNSLTLPLTKMYRDYVFPDVRARTISVPGYDNIRYLAGNNGNVVDVKERIDFHDLFESHCGHEFFKYIRDELCGEYDFVLLNAPAGHQEISGIFCGHMADVIFAVDIDSPVVDPDVSYRTCMKLAERIEEEGLRHISVKSLKKQDPEEVVDEMLLEQTNER